MYDMLYKKVIVWPEKWKCPKTSKEGLLEQKKIGIFSLSNLIDMPNIGMTVVMAKIILLKVFYYDKCIAVRLVVDLLEKAITQSNL